MTRHFTADLTEDYCAAVAALKKLPLTQRGSAYAEATWRDLRTAFAERLGKQIIDQASRSWLRLIGKKSDPRDALAKATAGMSNDDIEQPVSF